MIASEHQIEELGKETFKELFDLHFKALCAFGNRYINDALVVEDLVQEVFIDFWGKKENFNHLAAIKAYLYKSVKNKSLNHLRHEKVLQKQFELLPAETEEYVANAVIEEETFNQLYQEIKDLPSASQAVMLLALNGLKNQEIADELDISLNTVKTQKKLAYAKLKSKIAPRMLLLLFFH